jgi:outer membrane protein assembly factor BamE (lipoprotein component of BamABCDE complex)
MKRFEVFVFACIVFIAGCVTRAPQNWSQLRVGLSRDEVQDLIGQPDSISSPVNFAPIVAVVATNAQPETAAKIGDLLGTLLDRSQERWVYGEDSVLGRPQEGYSVYFDSEGNVTGFRKPE